MHQKKSSVITGLAIALLSSGASVPVRAEKIAQAADGAAMLALRTEDIRVATIGYRLAISSNDLCTEHAPQLGLVVHTAAQYRAGYRELARRLFALGDLPSVEGVVAGGAAQQAGLAPADEIVAVNGDPVNAEDNRTPKASYDGVKRVLDSLDKAAQLGPVTITIARNHLPILRTIRPVSGCASSFQLIPSASLDSGADGNTITVNSALVEFVRNDDELALIVAHELSHNILGHRTIIKEMGISGNISAYVGGGARLVRRTEQDADYLALYLMARAGYSYKDAPSFWRRLGKAVGLGFISDPAHPGWRDREASAAAAVVEIDRKRLTRSELMPELDHFQESDLQKLKVKAGVND